MHDYDDKELKLKIFKIRLAKMANTIDENLFEQIFGHILIKLANKVINIKNKEENQIIVKNISKNIDKRFEMGDDKWVDSVEAANFILDYFSANLYSRL